MSVLRVSKDKNHYHTISEAINMAEPGSTVLIKPGIYREDLNIYKELTLAGEGNSSDIIIENNEDTLLKIKSEKFTLKNLTLSCHRDYPVIDLQSCRAVIEKCNISGGKYGIFAGNKSTSFIEDCTVSKNQTGIIATDASVCTVKNSSITSNYDTGIIFSHSEGTVENTLLSHNKTAGLEIASKSKGKIIKSKICNGEIFGVLIRDESTVFMEDCEITDNSN